MKKCFRIKNRKRIPGILSAVLVFALSVPAAVFAAGEGGASGNAAARTGADGGSIRFKVSQTFNVKEGAVIPAGAEKVSYRLSQSAEPDEGCVIEDDHRYTITCTGSDGMTASLPDAAKAVFTMEGNDAAATVAAVFRHAGVYKFILKPDVVSREGFTYDAASYTLRFFVKNESGGGLSVRMTAQRGTGSQKPDQISFAHVCTLEPEPTVTPSPSAAPKPTATPAPTVIRKPTAGARTAPARKTGRVRTGDTGLADRYLLLCAAAGAAAVLLAAYRRHCK